MNWIYIKDKLPNPHVDVFIFPRPEYHNVMYVGEMNSKGEWLCWVADSFGSSPEKITVTHWMPIPDDPK
jgi:hypothetical protein